MRFNSPTPRFLLSAVFLVAFSCTIIEDSDITSTSELSKLKWKGLEIKQIVGSSTTTVSATLVYDSALNIVDATTGAKVIRRLYFSLGTLGSSKLKLRSGSTTKTEFYISYKEGNQPYTVAILQGDSIIESYQFRYDANNRLNKIITTLNPVDNLPATLRTNDTIIYDTSFKPETVTRRLPGGALAGTLTLYYNGSELTRVVPTVPITPSVTEFQVIQANCSNETSSAVCGGLMEFQPSVGGGGAVQFNYQNNSFGNLLNQVIIEDFRGSNNREAAKFYFHPLMLINPQLSFGSDLLMIYSIDWWVRGGATSGGGGNVANEYVFFNFIYGL